MTDYVLSVVVPVYNPGKLLEAQLAALCSQQLDEPWEIILADNGTTDSSLRALHLDELPVPTRVVDASTRRGPSYARNQGAGHSVAPWLVFCDSDDIASPHWLSNLWAAREDGDIICGAWDVRELNEPFQLKARGGPLYGTELPEGPCGFLSYAPSCNVLISRDLFTRLGGWDESLSHCEDVDLSWRAQIGGYSLAFADKAVMHYRFRRSLSAMVMQIYRYKTAEAALYAIYRAHGAQRQPLTKAIGRWWWIASRCPYVALDRERRSVWLAVLASAVGRAHGSVVHRVFYP